MFLLAELIFRPNPDKEIVMILAAFAVIVELRSLPPPGGPRYISFRPGRIPQREDILQLIKPFRNPPPADERTSLGALISWKQQQKINADRKAWETAADADCTSLALRLLTQWPRSKLEAPSFSHEPLVDVSAALKVIQPEWERLGWNIQLSNYLSQAQHVLDSRRSDDPYRVPKFVTAAKTFPTRQRGQDMTSLASLLRHRLCGLQMDFEELLAKKGMLPIAAFGAEGKFSNIYYLPDDESPQSVLPDDTHLKSESRRPDVHEIDSIVNQFGRSNSLVRQRYAQDLMLSLKAFQGCKTVMQLEKPSLRWRDFRPAERRACEILIDIQTAVQKPNPDMSLRRKQWWVTGRFWPAITPITLLEQLRSTNSKSQLGSGVKAALIKLGISITELQREVRLSRYFYMKDEGRYQEEETNAGHTNWKPEEYPDWLLLEIESDILIRPAQVDVALATISPASGENAVLQMNMGKGMARKSSVWSPD